MFRLIGFLLGSALSVGVFLLVFGLPELADKTALPEDKPTQPAETKPDPELPAPEELAAKLLDTIKHEFNEIKAECAGTIEKVLVNNSDSVEFGQTMMLVRPD